MVKLEAIQRFMKGIDKDGPIPKHKPDLGKCWIWTRSPAAKNGQMSIKRKCVSVSRFSYEFFNGPLPKTLEIKHLCKNGKCVNPKHLRALARTFNDMIEYLEGDTVVKVRI